MFSLTSSRRIGTNNYLTDSFLVHKKKKMMRIQALSKMLSEKQGGAAVLCRRWLRWMVTKAANRVAVHGSKLPVPSIVREEEVEMEINKATEENEKQRRKMENTLDSHLNIWQVLHIEDIVSK